MTPCGDVRTTLGCILLAAVLAASLAQAQERPEPERTAFELGFRAGVSFPFGQLSSGKNLNDWVELSFPLTFEIGARFLGRYELAAVGQYAVGTVVSPSGSGCYSGSNACSASTGQIGVEFLYHPLGMAPVDPFVGYGVNYEWLVIRATVDGNNYNQALGGWNWAVLQAGVDFSIGRVVRLGPYALASFGDYYASNYTVPTPSGPQSGSSSVANPALHIWLSVGIRVVVLP